MSTEHAATTQRILQAAQDLALQQPLPYAGRVTAPQAWHLLQHAGAILIDVRTQEERHFVGHVPASLHVPWASGTALTRNPRFVKELATKIPDKAALVLLLCRSGNRSAAAAAAATQAGFTQIYNIEQGFEGDLDATQQRGHQSGWRWHRLPWVQN